MPPSLVAPTLTSLCIFVGGCPRERGLNVQQRISNNVNIEKAYPVTFLPAWETKNLCFSLSSTGKFYLFLNSMLAKTKMLIVKTNLTHGFIKINK